MIAWLQANWLWLLLGAGLFWFMARRGGGCCGMGNHHTAHDERHEQSAIAEEVQVNEEEGNTR